MKYFLSFLFIFYITPFSFSQTKKIKPASDGKCIEGNWKLEFEDDFNSKEIDKNVWQVRVSSQGSSANDGTDEYYSFDNVKLENGICKLIPKKETVIRKAVSWKADSVKLEDGISNARTYNYTSAWIETKQKFYYGKYEIRCKIPKGKSLWPAFWMYGENNGVNNELDVFEFWNPQNNFGKYSAKKLSMIDHMTVHYNRKMSTESFTGPDFSLDYHTYAVIWDSTKIEWYVDGDLKRTFTQYQTGRGKNVDCKDVKANHTYTVNPIFPKDPMVILVNIALQSGKNAPDENTFNNPSFDIDYIRYYKIAE